MANYEYVDSGLDSSDSEDEQIEQIDPIIQAYNQGYEEGLRTAEENQEADYEDVYERGVEDGYRQGVLEMIQEGLVGEEDGTPEELLEKREANRSLNVEVLDHEEENWDHLFDN